MDKQLKDSFVKYRKSRIEFDMIKSDLTDQIRIFEQEKIAADLKKQIVTEMLKQGDFSTMSKMPEAFYTEETESDTRYSFLAEAAVLAAEYFIKQGFVVDVRWVGEETRPYGKKRKSKAGIFFDLTPSKLMPNTENEDEKTTKE